MAISGGLKSIENLINSLTNIASSSGTATQLKTVDNGHKYDDDYIIGLPPALLIGGNEVHSDVSLKYLQSMFVIELHPGYPEYKGIQADTGLDLFSVSTSSGEEKFNKIIAPFTSTCSRLKSAKFPIRIAVLNDVSVSESWSNDFGESRFEDAANVGSAFGQEIRYISGQESIVSGIADIGKNISGLIGGANQGLGDALSGIVGMAEQGGKWGENLIKNNTGNLGKGLLQLASGSKVDFPQVWRGTSYTPSYSFTCRLYNPRPNDEAAYLEYIITPLIMLLAFMTPMSDSNFTFGFPILCKAKCPGLFGLEAAYIQTMDIVKGGGDGADISFNQRPGSVDIRFTLGSLYSTMIARGEQDVSEDRPTLDTYISYMLGKTEYEDLSAYNKKSTSTDYSTKYGSWNTTPSTVVTVPVSDNNFVNNRVTVETLDAFFDPILNFDTLVSQGILEPTITTLNSISSYKSDISALIENFRGSSSEIKTEDSVALKIKNGINLSEFLVNWFWSNLDSFDVITQSIVEDVNSPSISPIEVSVDDMILLSDSYSEETSAGSTSSSSSSQNTGSYTDKNTASLTSKTPTAVGTF